uniref:NACHT domain- and WD repeat-containing protein 1-like isoform X1 n=1 Tax=Styela clava TaxID=7725 RepID=UPI00193A29BB|nr:NACHT domain- and WD repeat-containing protein 1-like isoform X1 [Styela clava]
METTKSSNYRNDLMKGRIRAEKKSSSNIVRIFVSSTFSDLTDERNVLYTHAYPELRNFCQSLGLEFHAIDMRWGVRDTASVDHSTTALCLLEVQNCKRISLGPYFVVFFGNRYGYQPLPNSIPDTVFTQLHHVAIELGMDKGGLLDKWYKLDTNSIPHARILEPITKIYSHFDDITKEFEKEREADRQGWNTTFKELSTVIKDTANIAADRGLVPRDVKAGFSKSITQMEIEEGLQNREGGFLAYNREISDLLKHTGESKAGIYVDMIDGEDTIDKERQKLLKNLKKNVKQRTEGKKMFKKYDVTFKQLEAVYSDAEDVGKGKYLDVLSGDFVSDIKRIIVKCMEDKKQHAKMLMADDSLLEEVGHHANFEVLKTTDFCGREQLIGEISDLINDPHNQHPIVLVGSSGSGKTSLMAKLVEKERNRSSESFVVYRFLGTSPDSSNIHKLLTSLILQISTAYGEDLPPSFRLQNFADVVELFSKLLKDISKLIEKNNDSRTLTIFLDSIDQLSIEDGAHRMTWLPKIISGNVRVVISSLPEPDFEIVPTMRKYVPESNMKNVNSLNVETAKEILQKCLGNVNRCLTETQTKIILSAFEKSPFPLFLKLMVEEAKKWRSHDNVDDLVLAETSREAISNFYDRLEKDHGKMFASRALGYLVAARDGVTENELQDLLSLDDEVMHDVYQYWSPPSQDVARIPAFTWTRLYYDLGEYIVQRQATGHTVLALYHRQFIEVARQRYLQEDDSVKVYKVLSEYFSNKYGEGQKKSLALKMWDRPKEVDRRVANQPLQFSNAVFNVRKMRELPYCLLQAGLWDELRENVLANSRWLKTKIKAFSIKEAIEDFDLALKQQSDTETRLIRDAIKLAKPTLEFPAGVRNHLFAELFCRLKYFSDEFPQFLGKLVNKCYNSLKDDNDEVLLPLNGYFQPPGGPLRTTITGFQTPVTQVKFSSVESIFAAGSSNGSLMVWDTKNDEVVHRIDAHSDAVLYIAFTEVKGNNKVATCSKDKMVKMFYLDNGNQCFEAIMPQLETTIHAKLHLTANKIVCVSDHLLQCWDSITKESKLLISIDNCVSASTSFISTDRNMVIVGQETGKCVGFDVETGQETGSMAHPSDSSTPISSIIDLQPETNNILAVWEDGSLSSLLARTFEIVSTTSSKNANVIDCDRSRDGFSISISFSNAVEVYIVKDGQIKLTHSVNDHHDAITKARFVDEHTLAIAYATKKVVLWKLRDGNQSQIINTWEGTGASIDHLEIGERVGVTASSQMFYLKLWDLRTEDVIPPHPSLQLEETTNTLSSDGKYITYEKDGKVVTQCIEDVNNIKESNENIQIIPGLDSHAVKSVKFSNQGQSVIVLQMNGKVMKFGNDISFMNEDTKDLPNCPKMEEQSSFFEEGIHVILIFIPKDEKYIGAVIKSSDEKTASSILLLNADDLTISRRISLSKAKENGNVTAIRAIENAIILGTSTGCLFLYSKNNEGQYRESGAFSSHQNSITCIAVSNNDNLLFSGSTGRVRRIWTLKNGIAKVKHELRFESLLESGVTCAQFSPGDNYLFTGSKERSITIWDTETGELLGAHYVYAPVLDLVITTDRRLVFTSELGYIAMAKFRPPNESRRSYVKSSKSHLSNRSSTCILM